MVTIIKLSIHVRRFTDLQNTSFKHNSRSKELHSLHPPKLATGSAEDARKQFYYGISLSQLRRSKYQRFRTPPDSPLVSRSEVHRLHNGMFRRAHFDIFDATFRPIAAALARFDLLETVHVQFLLPAGRLKPVTCDYKWWPESFRNNPRSALPHDTQALLVRRSCATCRPLQLTTWRTDTMTAEWRSERPVR